jgi:hypothetical protein
VERRSHARFAHRIEIEGPPDGEGTVARMVASDLSMGGLHCSSSRDYPEMTRLAVRLQLPNGAKVDTLVVQAVVVRRMELASSSGAGRYELGLFFTGMSEQAKERLARFLARASSN